MLEIDYPTQFGELIQSTDCDIELPVEWTDFFEERGEVAAFIEDARNNRRLRIRTHGLMWFERTLPFCKRSTDPVVCYTRDFSRIGAGILVPFQIFPEEKLRLVLPTFWVQLHVVRARRITSKCYEIGTQLMGRHDPGPEAFDLQNVCSAAQ
ncbi:MAG: PilZ domain-containing protein [Rubripirellula sp.]